MFTRNRPVVSRLTSLMVALSVLGGGIAFYLTSHPTRAQAQGTANLQPPKEVQDLQIALEDLHTLNDLLPMKFTPDQLDKLSAAITSSQADYDKKYTALSRAPLLKMADEIRETRKKALAGTTIPATFIERVSTMQTDLIAKRSEIDAASIVALSAACKAVMTPEQIARCTQMEIDAYKRSKRYNEKATEAQYFNAYVLDLFVNSPRIVPLLKEMSAAQSTKKTPET